MEDIREKDNVCSKPNFGSIPLTPKAPQKMPDAVKFSATIETISPDGCAAIARLTEKTVDGLEYVVINHDTTGRINVMNGVGCLKPDTNIRGSAVIGIDALKAITVEVAN